MTKQPFEGIKVADFSWYAVGPEMTRYLANSGATVVRIESTTRVDGFRSTPPFRDKKPGVNRSDAYATFNSNKYGVTLNLKHPRGLEIARKFVSWADVVAENFTAGTIDKLGLGYEEIRKVKPDIIMISSCNQGQTGPHAQQAGFGSHLTSLSGFVDITGWQDREPVCIWGPYTDFISVRFGVAALMAALDYRRRTGKGMHIDLSQYEASLNFLAPLLLDYSVNGRVAGRIGNSSPHAVPHGVYPCKGEDRWCAISVYGDEEWRAFCRALGKPDWSQDPQFATFALRKAKEEEINQRVAEVTSNFTAEELMKALQAVGVAAGAVKTWEDLFEHDPQLKLREQFVWLEHPEIGKHTYTAPAYLLSQTPPDIRMPAPCLGQHNEYVYTKLLGYSDEEFLKLLESGALD